MKKTVLTGCFVWIITAALAQEVITPVQYIDRYKEIAISEMKRTGVPAAITLAQGLLETESGNGELVKKSNNHFGIKCKSGWTSASVSYDDDAKGECFRQYNTAEESYRDHSDFLRNSQRYSSLFNLDITDYKGWAYGLKKAGYATNPAYSQMLIKNIERYNLQQYTVLAADQVPVVDSGIVENNKEDEIVAEAKIVTDSDTRTSNNKHLSINGSKCLYINKGTSLLAVASENNISLSKLLAFNDLTEDGLLAKDQYIFTEKKPKTGDKAYCVTAAGESLYDVAQRNGIQLKSLLEYNQLVGSEYIDAGTRLYLQPVITAAPKAQVIAHKTITHVVQPKESLYSIAKKYNTSVAKLRDWNKLRNEAVSAGQRLKVSQ
jgi:LysM repeat protein